MPVPNWDYLLEPLFQAMKELGGSATNQEQEDTVAEILKLSDEDLAEIHRDNTTIFSYRLAWARTALKDYGVLSKSSRAVWSLTPSGQETGEITKDEVNKHHRARFKKQKEETEEEEDEELVWKEKALDLLKAISPDAFERLCQLVLRESGFTSVEVTGKSGDGGVDGKGVLRLGGMLSFHVIFQCKRYKGSVSSPVVRDFRGAMVGRADKGLLITTGTFTRDARKEAQRDGTSPIDLIDGYGLVEKLKELGLGISVKKKVSEEVFVESEYFKDL